MLRFEDPTYLWLLLVIPILAMVRFGVWRQRKKKLQRFGNPVLLKKMMPDVSAYYKVLAVAFSYDYFNTNDSSPAGRNKDFS